MRSDSEESGGFFVGLLVAIGFSIALLAAALVLYFSI